jgi:hypothetical protein
MGTGDIYLRVNSAEIIPQIKKIIEDQVIAVLHDEEKFQAYMDRALERWTNKINVTEVAVKALERAIRKKGYTSMFGFDRAFWNIDKIREEIYTAIRRELNQFTITVKKNPEKDGDE